MKAAINVIEDCLKYWNTNCQKNNIKQEYTLNYSHRFKKYYVNKKDYYEREICELTFSTKGEKNLLLWRREYQVPEKANITRTELVNSLKDDLYQAFTYEMLGCFSVTTEQFITNQDYAEYDIENDRLKQHESGKGMIISAIEDGAWFKKGDEFDVFMEGDDAYFIYTEHLVGKENNGIAKVIKDKFMIVKDKVQSIILLDDLK